MATILSIILLLAGAEPCHLREMAAFAKAMHGPNVGCSWARYSSRSCWQKPGEPMVCRDFPNDSVGTWLCDGFRGFRPEDLAYDLTGDLDVDLADFAKLQNMWGRE